MYLYVQLCIEIMDNSGEDQKSSINKHVREVSVQQAHGIGIAGYRRLPSQPRAVDQGGSCW